MNQQAIENMSYQVSVINYEVVQGEYAMYLIKVVGPNNIAFHIKDRYSSIRNFQSELKRSFPNKDAIPEFPQKKYFDNLNPNWLEQRKTQLGLFLNTFLAHPLVKQSPLVPVYFKDHATGEGSKESIEYLAAYMNGNAPALGSKSPMGGRKPLPPKQTDTGVGKFQA